MIGKTKIGSLCLLAMLASACAEDKEGNEPELKGTTMSFNMTRAPQDIVNNTQVYLFKSDGTENFISRILGVNYSTNLLTMAVQAGTWDFGLVGAETDIASSIIPPAPGQSRASQKLWETQPVAGALPNMPELRTAYITGQTVVANTNNTAGPTLLSRNVALVKVVVEEGNGLDVAGTHRFELSSVPTSLYWDGKLYPNKNNPTVSASPMKGNFAMSSHPSKPGYQVSDTLQFIIPAHKGTDFLSNTPVDTTTHHLKMSIDFACQGGTRYQKADVEIPRVPRINGILLVRLLVGGKIEVSTEILPWVDESLNADLSQTQLYTDKASVGLAYKDTLYVNTNAASFTVAKDPGAAWITSVIKLPNNAVEITANVDTYVDNNPRSSYITITANNVTKKIPVTQRPDRGTIKVSVDKMFLSPPHPTKSLVVTSIGGNWRLLAQGTKTTAAVALGNVGNTNVSFTRKSTSDESQYANFYGDEQLVVKNLTTLDTDTIKLSNLFIGIEDGLIEVAQPTAHSDTICTVDNVTVYGGDVHSLSIVNKPTWIYPAPATYYNPATGVFTFKCDREPNEEERYGEMILRHSDDPDYTVTVRILQDIIVRIPEFHYFVVQFVWSVASDVDIKVGFSGNPSSVVVGGVTYPTTSVSQFENKFAGWSHTANNSGSHIDYNGDPLIVFGGDAMKGEGETVFFNAPVINSAPYPGQYGVTPSTPGLLPRTLTLQVNVAWYTSPPPNYANPLDCNINCYLGGTMSHVGTNFYNNGGHSVYTNSRRLRLDKTVSTTAKVYNHVADIIYDRKKHVARVEWKMNPYALGARYVPTPVHPAYSAEYLRQISEEKDKVTKSLK